MPITFNAILQSSGIDPKTVRLLRHQDSRTDKDRTPYLLWRNHHADFVTYQARQSAKRQKLFGTADYWAVFVRTPTRENLFAGLYSVGECRPGYPNAASVSVIGAFEGDPDNWIEFDIQKSDHLSEYDGKLAIDWGSGALAWAQYAHKHEKPITAIHAAEPEPEFPGYLRVMLILSDVPGIYSQWKLRLSEARGVYVLTSINDKALYVGSATGAGGFYERWCEHARKGGDAVQFRNRKPGEYQVSILEVAGSNASDRDIIHAEQLWMEKLQTRDMGLNGGLIQRPSVRTITGPSLAS